MKQLAQDRCPDMALPRAGWGGRRRGRDRSGAQISPVVVREAGWLRAAPAGMAGEAGEKAGDAGDGARLRVSRDPGGGGDGARDVGGVVEVDERVGVLVVVRVLLGQRRVGGR